MKKIIKTKLLKRISAMFVLPTVFLSSVAMGIGVNYSKAQPVKKYEMVTPTFGLPAPNQISSYALPQLKSGATPETLLTLPPLDVQNGSQINTEKFKAIVKSLQNQGWLTSKVNNIYQEAVKSIMIEQGIGGLFKNSSTSAAAGMQKFNDPDSIWDITRELNQFKNVSKKTKLEIIRPTHVYQYFSAAGKNLQDATITTPTDFSYKVATLNIDSKNGDQIDDDKNVIYKFKDNSSPSKNNHDYSLIFNNQHNQIVDGLAPATGTATKTLTQLIDSRDIFIRDETTQKEYDFNANPASGAFNNNLIKLRYKGGRIEVFVNPKVANKTTGPGGSAVEFWLDPTTTPKGKRYGILDNSLSPLHLKEATKGITAPNGLIPALNAWNKNPIDPTKSMTSNWMGTQVYYLRSNWKVENNLLYKGTTFSAANHLRVFMAKGAGSLEFSLRFDGKGADSFNNSDNKIIVKLNQAGQLTRPRSSLQITRTAWNAKSFGGSVNPVGVSINKLNSDWYQIDVFTQQGAISINPDPANPGKESPYRIKDPTSKIFFEPPKAGVASTVNGKTTGQDIVNIEQQTKQGQFNKVILGKLFANWSNHKAAATNWTKSGWLLQKNKTWFQNQKANPKLVATAAGEPLFGVNHDVWEEKNHTFTKLGTKDGILPNNLANATKRLIEQDPKTGSPIKTASGDYKTIPATGENIVKQLETLGYLYFGWIKQFDPSKSRATWESFLISDVNRANGFVQKQIVQQSGGAGQMVNEVVASVLAKVFGGTGNVTTKTQDEWQKAFDVWESGNSLSTLTPKELALLKPLIDNYGDTAPWSGSYKLANIKALNKAPKGGNVNTTTKAYKDALQYMMWVTAPYLIDAMKKIFEEQSKQFDKAKSSVIGKYMALALNSKSSSKNISAITSSSIKSVPDNELPNYLKGIGLQEIDGNPLYKVNSIKLALASLIKFVYDTKLQTRFLSANEAADFNGYYKNGLLTDATMYGDKSKRQDIVKAVGLLDKIINKVLNKHKTKAKTFEEIINDLLAVKIRSPQAAKDALIKTISTTLDIIASPSQAYTYKYFGGVAYSTFVQNLIMGKNVQQVVRKWRDDQVANQKKFDSTIINELLKNDSAYDEKELTRLAINTGNYNLDYFIKSFTAKGYVAEAASRLYNADIQTAISFELPKGGALVEAISNPEAFAKYIYGIIGLIILFTGIFAIVLSFRGTIKGSQKKSNIMIMRGAFSFMIVGGISLICFTILAIL